jgi:hypothetical protein
LFLAASSAAISSLLEPVCGELLIFGTHQQFTRQVQKVLTTYTDSNRRQVGKEMSSRNMLRG